jgi:hypothetical protein
MFGITLKSTIREFFPPLFLSSLQDYWKNSFHTGQTWNEYRKFYGACRVYSIIKKDDKFSGTKDKVLGKTKKRAPGS